MDYRSLVPVFDELRSDRLILRRYRVEDAADLKAAIEESREHLRPWLPFAGAHQTLEESQDWIIQKESAWRLRNEFSAGIWRMSDSQFLGGIGLHPRVWEIRSFMIGYWLRASATGQGYMVEAVRCLTDYTLGELQAQRVEIVCSTHNERSAVVARSAGYMYEGTLRNDHLASNGQISSRMVFSIVPGDRDK